MTEWRRIQMRDLMVEFHDGPHATPAPANAGPIYLGIKNITDAGVLDLRDIRHIGEADYARWTRRATPEPGDVVFTYEATLHRYALIPDGFRGCLGRRLALIRPDRSVVLPRFLHFLMLGPTWRATVTDRIISGSTVDRIPIIEFPEFPIDLPGLATQHAVVGVLGALDDLIENNRRRIELLEQMGQAIYREWFVRFRYPGHEDATLVDSPLGLIPEGWEVKPLAAIVNLDRTAVQPRRFPGEVFDHYSIPAFDSGRLPVIDAGETIKSGKFLLTSPAVLVSKLNPRIERTWFVELGSHRRSVASTEFLILRPQAGFSLEFLYLLTRSSSFQERMRELSGGTSTSHQRAKPADFLGIEIVAPPVLLADQLVDAVASQLRMARIFRVEASRLAAIRDLLLPKLVTGQIEVSKLDLDAVVESVA